MQHDLNDTLIFVKVAEHGSFTAAARALGLPKTTVSRKLRELEERLGARLLNRTTRRLSLTEAGVVYLDHSRRIATDLDEAESAVQQLEGSPRGWLRVTAPYSFGVTALAPMLVDFGERYPDVRLDVVLSNDRLDLVANKIDVALRIGPLPDSSLVARRLAVHRTSVYAGIGYLARQGEPSAPEDLAHHHALVGNEHRRGRRYAWPLSNGDGWREFGVQPVMAANDPATMLALLAGGQGLMLANDLMVQCCMGDTAVRRVLPAWRGPDMEINALFLGGRGLSPKVRVFVDFVAEQMALKCPGPEQKEAAAESYAQPEVAGV